MNKRIRNKKQKQIWRSPVVSLERYHCDECNQNIFVKVHESLVEKTLKYLDAHAPLCPFCKKELKKIDV